MVLERHPPKKKALHIKNDTSTSSFNDKAIVIHESL